MVCVSMEKFTSTINSHFVHQKLQYTYFYAATAIFCCFFGRLVILMLLHLIVLLLKIFKYSKYQLRSLVV